MKRSRLRRIIWTLIACLCAPIVMIQCIPPASLKQVKEPRAGRAMGKVAIVYSKHYQINLAGFERTHAFDIHKYAKIYLALLTEGHISPEDIFVPSELTREQILLVHSDAFIDSLSDSAKVASYLEAPAVAMVPAALVDAGILHAMRYSSGGTLEAARQALVHGIGINIGGGYHHAKPDAGEGFCVYNDLAIAVRALQAEGLVRRALIIDLDVHQGNGTAVCLAAGDDVFTFDMHQSNIYPIPKERNDSDVGLPADTGDVEYLAVLRQHLPTVIDQARPDIVLFQAGCDVLAGDPLASLALTHEGIVERDATVIDECVRRNLPIVMTLGGGYSDQAWQVQHESIRRTLQHHGGDKEGRQRQGRQATLKERKYTR